MILSQEDEKIIQEEVKLFYMHHIKKASYVNVSSTVDALQIKLQNYYYENMRAIFLDTLLKFLNEFLELLPENHTKLSGLKRVIFYVRQEISILPTIVHSKTGSNQSRTKVFISYSRANDKYFKEIQVHFAPHKSRFEVWSDKEIKAGEKWKDEIKKALSETKIAIFLVSADFFASDFIMSEELPTLLKAAESEGATVLSVILEPVAQASFKLSGLDIYQAMNPPEKPLSGMNDVEKGQVYANLIDQAIKILDQN